MAFNKRGDASGKITAVLDEKEKVSREICPKCGKKISHAMSKEAFIKGATTGKVCSACGQRN